MASYSLGPRFPKSHGPYRLLDPGAYQNGCVHKAVHNKVGFNSKTPRVTAPGNPMWTHSLGSTPKPPRIPNCSSLMSKVPRFPYEAFGPDDLKELLCRCGIEDTCECPSEEVAPQETVCQAKVPKKIYIGPPPRSPVAALLPPREEITKDVIDPPFYDARVSPFTDFYKGCKWSSWTSKRNPASTEKRPGPAEYSLEHGKNAAELCAEAFRSECRRTSKQPRYIEMIQRKETLEGRPGPSSYSPNLPKGTDLQYLGPKAERFPTQKHVTHPGPADHYVKRCFDLPESPVRWSTAPLPPPPFFGVRAKRFKAQKEEGASPASFDTRTKLCQHMNCSTAPFGTSAKRWKETEIPEDDSDDESEVPTSDNPESECPKHSWFFRSETVRMKPLVKMPDEQSPADMAQQTAKVYRHPYLQYMAPFNSSDGRFQPWFNWVPVFGDAGSSGPGDLEPVKPRCPNAVARGPLVRSARFRPDTKRTPAPNEYHMQNGIETVLKTHNTRLKKNMQEAHKFVWEPPVDTKALTFEEKESLLFNKSIKLLEGEDLFAVNNKSQRQSFRKPSIALDKVPKPKLLRCFLYKKQIPNCV